eukprot:Sro24_g016230.2  (205) ;mRNA; r:10954-11568
MHQMQLVVEHSIGRRKRYKDKKVCDSFKACEQVRKDSEAAAGWIQSKKSRGRWIDFVKELKKVGRHAVMVLVPNHTRSAGVMLRYAGMIRSRWNYKHYYNKNHKALELDDNQFWMIAQLYAVLFAMRVILMQTQTDGNGTISYAPFFIYRVFFHYVTADHYWVPETRRSETPDKEGKWDGNAHFPRQKFDGTPTCPRPTVEGEG